jgi:hypothetical protein
MLIKLKSYYYLKKIQVIEYLKGTKPNLLVVMADQRRGQTMEMHFNVGGRVQTQKCLAA